MRALTSIPSTVFTEQPLGSVNSVKYTLGQTGSLREGEDGKTLTRKAMFETDMLQLKLRYVTGCSGSVDRAFIGDWVREK